MPACTFKCHTRFITNSEVVEQQLIRISDDLVKKEIEKGFHKNSGQEGFKTPLYGKKVPLSPILNHCFLIKSSQAMAKEYLAFHKDAGCTPEELDTLASKIEIFMSASSLSDGDNDGLMPEPKKPLNEMNEAELQAEAQDKGVKDWDTMGKKELIRAIKRA